MHARDMRVSDSERERVAAFLRDQALEGRLDHEELEERLGGAYRAKTAGDLEDLIEDLPHRRVPSAARAAPPRRREPPRALVGLGVVLVGLCAFPTLLAGGFAIVAALGIALVVTLFALGFVFGPFILIGLLIAQAVRRRGPRPRHWSPHPR
jgi:hypothetical protein